MRRKRPESTVVLSSGEILFRGSARDTGVVAGSSGTLEMVPSQTRVRANLATNWLSRMVDRCMGWGVDET